MPCPCLGSLPATGTRSGRAPATYTRRRNGREPVIGTSLDNGTRSTEPVTEIGTTLAAWELECPTPHNSSRQDNQAHRNSAIIARPWGGFASRHLLGEKVHENTACPAPARTGPGCHPCGGR